MGYKHSEINRTSLYDRVEKLLVSYDWSDCSFSMSGKTFKAHKLIMGISSPVFEAMFYGSMSTADDIEIVDIEPEIFQLLLNFIYTDKVEISSIEEAFELLYASRKYLLEHLSELCISYIQENLSIDNVVTILNYPEFMQDKELVSAAVKLFCQHASYLLKEKKSTMTPACLKTILDSNQMNVKEKDLIKHVFDWTKTHCEQKNLSKELKDKRDILMENDLLKSLRFCTLSETELDDIVSNKDNLLLPNEVQSIKKLLIEPNDSQSNTFIPPQLNSTLSSRETLKLQWHLCHRTPLRSVAPIVIGCNNFTIYCKLKANKSVFVTSLCVPTRMAPTLNFNNNPTEVYSEQISVSVISEFDNSIIRSTNFMNTVEYNSIISIELSEPCYIEKDKWYKVNFSWPHNRFLSYSYMVEYRDRFYQDHKISFEFEDCCDGRGSNGGFLCGLKYCL